MTESEDLLADALAIIRAGEEAGVPIRLLGGLAILARSGQQTRDALGRTYGDIDLATDGANRKRLTAAIAGAGYAPEKRFNAIHGERRMIFSSLKAGYRVDVFIDKFEMCHSLTFRDRLVIEPTTLPAADLFLTKLQIAQINQKDLVDVYMLALDHSPAESDGAGTVNLARINAICSGDWGWFTTVGDNIERAEKLAPEFIGDKELCQIVVGRLRAIHRSMNDSPKQLAWRLRARVGRRVRWYETPEDVA